VQRECSALIISGWVEPAAKLLTDGKSLNGGPVWSNTGREVAFFSTARDGVSYDIDIVVSGGRLAAAARHHRRRRRLVSARLVAG